MIYSILLQSSENGSTLDNALAILRECVAARSIWRPNCLRHLMCFDCTDIIAKTLARVSDKLSDNGVICAFWILSALATKGNFLLVQFKLLLLSFMVVQTRNSACEFVCAAL